MREVHHPVDPLQGECTGPQASGELQQMAGAGEEVVVEGSAPHPLLHTVPGAAQVAPVLHRPANEAVGFCQTVPPTASEQMETWVTVC